MTSYSPAAEAYVQSLGFTPQAIMANFAMGADAAMAMAAFDAGVAHQEAECTTRGHFGAVTVPAEPITTAAELYALPDGSVVLSSSRDAWQKSFVDRDEWFLAEDPDEGAIVSAASLAERGAPLTLLAPTSPPVPAPVLLADPDDPRIKPGAVVTVLFKQDDDNAVTYRVRIGGSNPRGTVAWVRNCVGHEPVYLLAPAPDPDADVRQAIIETLAGLPLTVVLADAEAATILAGLRDRGVAK